MHLLNRGSVLVLLAFSTLFVTQAQAAAPPKVTITGTLPATQSGVRIFALPTSGGGVSGIVSTKGAFSLSILKSQTNGLSLQMLSNKGKYLGPIMLYASGATGATRLKGISSTSLALGAVNVYAGYAQLKTMLKPAAVQLSPGGVHLISGKPIGAGRLGLLPAGMKKSLLVRAHAAAAAGCSNTSSPESGAGGDCDSDGVPNVVDVDDDGDRTLDLADPQSAQSSANVVPYSGLRQMYPGAQNVQNGATLSTINQNLRPNHSGLGFAFYLDQQYLTKEPTPLDATWIECPSSMGWCSPGSSTAKVNGFSEIGFALDNANSRMGTLWSAFHGQHCVPGSGPDGASFVCTARPESYPAFGFNQMARPGRTTWATFFNPVATDTLGMVVPGDVMTLKWRASSSGEAQQMPITVQPYFVTTPGLKSATGDSTQTVTDTTSSSVPGGQSNPIIPKNDGTVSFEIYRPQRLALPSETGSYYDVGGLNWGVRIESATPVGGGYSRANKHVSCALSDLSGLNAISGSGPMKDLYPAIDATSSDQLTGSGGTITMGINAVSCASSVGLPTASGTVLHVALAAAGEPVSGGTNNTVLEVNVRIP